MLRGWAELEVDLLTPVTRDLDPTIIAHPFPQASLSELLRWPQASPTG